MSGRRPAVASGRAAAVLAAGVALWIAALLLPALAGAQEDPAPAPAPVAEAPAAGDPAAGDPAAGEPAGEATTTAPALVTPQGSTTGDAPLTESQRATRVLKFVMGGLVALAVAVAVATAVFWRRTRPTRIMAEEISRRPESPGRSAVGEGVPTPRVAERPQVFTPTPPPASAPTAARAPASRGLPADPPADAGAVVPATGMSPASVPVAAGAAPGSVVDDEAVPSGGLWASQGWAAPAPERDVEEDPVLPPGFVGRGDRRPPGPQEYEPGAGGPGTERWRPAAAEE